MRCSHGVEFAGGEGAPLAGEVPSWELHRGIVVTHGLHSGVECINLQLNVA